MFKTNCRIFIDRFIFLLTSVLFCCISFVCYASEDNNDTGSIVIPRMIDCHAEISTEDFELITEYVLDTYSDECLENATICNAISTSSSLSFSIKQVISTEVKDGRKIDHIKEDSVKLLGDNLRSVSPSKSFWKADICCMATAVYDLIEEGSGLEYMIGAILYSTSFSYIKTNQSSPLNIPKVELFITQIDDLWAPYAPTVAYYSPAPNTVYTMVNENPRVVYVYGYNQVHCGADVLFSDGSTSAMNWYDSNSLRFKVV